jgi:hypothetical protein
LRQRRDGPALLVNHTDIQLNERTFSANNVVDILGANRSYGDDAEERGK